MKLTRFRRLASLPILAFVFVNVAARPTSLQDRTILSARNAGDLKDNSPLAPHRRELLIYRSPLELGQAHSPPPPPRFDPRMVTLLGKVFFDPNLLAAIDTVVHFADKHHEWRGLLPAAKSLFVRYGDLFLAYTILASHPSSGPPQGDLYEVNLTPDVSQEMFRTMTTGICFMPDHTGRQTSSFKRRDKIVLAFHPEIPVERTPLAGLETWSRTYRPGHSIYSLVRLFYLDLQAFCALEHPGY